MRRDEHVQLLGLLQVVESHHLGEPLDVPPTDPQVVGRAVAAVGDGGPILAGVVETVGLGGHGVEACHDPQAGEQFLYPEQEFLRTAAEADVPGALRPLVDHTPVGIVEPAQERVQCRLGRFEDSLRYDLSGCPTARHAKAFEQSREGPAVGTKLDGTVRLHAWLAGEPGDPGQQLPVSRQYVLLFPLAAVHRDRTLLGEAAVTHQPTEVVGELLVPLLRQVGQRPARRRPGGLQRIRREHLLGERPLGVVEGPDHLVVRGEFVGVHPAAVRRPQSVARSTAEPGTVGEPQFQDLVRAGHHVAGRPARHDP